MTTATKDTLRAASVEDVIRRMRRTPAYAAYEVSALGWGMRHAQLDIAEAVGQACAAGLLTARPDARSGKTIAALTEAGRAYCTGSEWASIACRYSDAAARCACGETLHKAATGAWLHHDQSAECPAYQCACGRRHNASA